MFSPLLQKSSNLVLLCISFAGKPALLNQHISKS
jgi:hypothetical protein